MFGGEPQKAVGRQLRGSYILCTDNPGGRPATPPQIVKVKSQAGAWMSSAMSRGLLACVALWVSAAAPWLVRGELVGDRGDANIAKWAPPPPPTPPPFSHRCKSASRRRNSVAAGGFPQTAQASWETSLAATRPDFVVCLLPPRTT